MRLAVIKEGKTLLWISDTEKAIINGRLEPTRLDVFYNPLMEFNRDLSLIAFQAYINLYAPHKPVNILEPLSATGARGIRYATELDDVNKVIVNDINEKALNIIRKNVETNKVQDKVLIYKRDASSLMHTLHREDPFPISIIDLDPYGSPAPFADAAFSLIGHKGMLAVTATDLAVLSGSKPQKAYKRYWTEISPKIPQKKEIAVRVLLGYLAKIAASHDKAIKPLLSYYSDHYIRVYLLIERNATKAFKYLKDNIGFMIFCESTGYGFLSKRDVCCNTTGDCNTAAGPLWIGNLFDLAFLEEMIKLSYKKFRYLNTFNRIEKIMNIIKSESKIQNKIYQHIPSIASKIAGSLPPYDSLLKCLNDLGLYSTRTHFDPLGIRTEASYVDLTLCFNKLVPKI